jgi:hypothetical protein
LTFVDLGHKEPTLLLTSQLTPSASHLIRRYARRTIIENTIADGIDFFHMDALSSAVAMKVNCDLQLTLMASSLYRLLAVRVGQGYYEVAESRHLSRDLVDATAGITISESELVDRYQNRRGASEASPCPCAVKRFSSSMGVNPIRQLGRSSR